MSKSPESSLEPAFQPSHRVLHIVNDSTSPESSPEPYCRPPYQVLHITNDSTSPENSPEPAPNNGFTIPIDSSDSELEEISDSELEDETAETVIVLNDDSSPKPESQTFSLASPTKKRKREECSDEEDSI